MDTTPITSLNPPVSRRDAMIVAAAGLALAAMPRTGLASLLAGADTTLEWIEHERGGSKAFITGQNVPGGNVLLVRSGDASLLIDSKFPYLGPVLRDDAGGGSLTLINTHHHGDHTGGNGTLGAERVIAHENAADRIAGQFEQYTAGLRSGPRAAQASGLGRGVVQQAEKLMKRLETISPDDFAPTETVGAGDTSITVGDQRVDLTHVGDGHTDNDLIVRFENMNVVHTGDLVFNKAFPFYDQNAGATSVGWRASLAAILEMTDADTLVVPGHGEIGDRSVVEAQIDYFDQLEEAVKAEIADGQDLDTVKAKRWPFMEGFAFGQIAGTTIEGMYLEVTGQR